MKFLDKIGSAAEHMSFYPLDFDDNTPTIKMEYRSTVLLVFAHYVFIL